MSEVSGMTKDEAKVHLLNTMRDEVKIDFAKELRRLEEETKEQAEENQRESLVFLFKGLLENMLLKELSALWSYRQTM